MPGEKQSQAGWGQVRGSWLGVARRHNGHKSQVLAGGSKGDGVVSAEPLPWVR